MVEVLLLRVLFACALSVVTAVTQGLEWSIPEVTTLADGCDVIGDGRQ